MDENEKVVLQYILQFFFLGRKVCVLHCIQNFVAVQCSMKLRLSQPSLHKGLV